MVKISRRSFGKACLAAPLAGGLLTSGCKGKSKNFRIGMLLPKTGISAQMGFACERGITIAPDLFKGMGLETQTHVVDTESNPSVGRLKAEKLIHQGYDMLIGAFDSSVTAAVAELCEQRKVPFLINISAADRITEQGYKYVFRNFPKASNLIKSASSYLKELTKHYNFKTAAVLAIQDTFGQGMTKSIQTHIKDFSLEIKDIVTYDPNTRDLSAEISRLKQQNIDVVLPICRMNDAILIMRESVKQHYQPKLFFSPGSPGMYESQFFKNLGQYANYCVTATAWQNPRTRLSQKARSLFLSKYPNEHFDMNAAFTLEAMYIAAMAYKEAGTKDPEALTEALRNTHLTNRFTYGDAIEFDAQGQAKDIHSLCLQNQNNEPQIILPKDMQQIKPVIPMPRWN